MLTRDQLKLLEVGFTIIRKEIREGNGGKVLRLIKAKNKERKEWYIYAKDFESNNAIEKRMAALLKNPMIIED